MLSFFTNCFDNALYPVMFVDYLEEAVWAYTKQDLSEEVAFCLRAFIISLCCFMNIKVRVQRLVHSYPAAGSRAHTCRWFAFFLAKGIVGKRPAAP